MVKRIAPPTKGQVEYFDTSMPGFALRLSYSGTKAWVLMTRVRGSPKLIRMTLGEWPAMSLAEAHEEAREAQRHAKAGRDPREVRRNRETEVQETAKLTFAKVAGEFLARYAEPKLRARTVEEYRRTFKSPRIADWQDRPIASIDRRDVMRLLDELEAGGKHGTAKLTLAYLRKFFGWCAERDLITETPVRRLRPTASLKPRERALRLDELWRVWEAAAKVGGLGGALVKLLILTGQRRFETSAMRWSDLSGIETNAPIWSIPADITKNHRPHQVPLSPHAVAIIKEQPTFLSAGDRAAKSANFVFTTTGTTPFSGWSKLKTQLDKALAADGREPLAGWTFHDLRRSLVTGLHEHGLAQPHVIELIVNHVSGLRGGIAGIYDKSARMDERRRTLDAWTHLITTGANDPLPVRPEIARA
jgi:integrase